MNRVLHAIKPRASSRVQVLLAGLLWTVVGSGLLLSGARWIAGGGFTPGVLALLLLGLALGALKSRFVLDRAAERIAGRIALRGEGRCLGGFLSVRSWLLVLAMIVFGRLLRRVLPLPVAGVLYTAIGTGLLLSSRLPWQRWRTTPGGREG